MLTVILALLALAVLAGVYLWRSPAARDFLATHGPTIFVIVVAIVVVASFLLTVWGFAVHPAITGLCVLVMWTPGMIWAWREVTRQDIRGAQRVLWTVFWPFTAFVGAIGRVQ